MIKIMLVAGKNSQSLATFLEQRGTFTVDFVYNDLTSNSDTLLQSVIKVDKLVYVHQVNDSDTGVEINARLDMQTLREMLLHNKFFKTEEILFLSDNSEDSKQAKKYFLAVMEECRFKQYNLLHMDGMSSYSSVYDNLIGVTRNKDFKNSYRTLYRRSRGDDAVVAYEPSDDRETVLEPFDYEQLKMWDERKSLARSIESTIGIEDKDDYSYASTVNPVFGLVETNDILPSGDLILVTGDKKTGKSTWGTILANSAVLNGKRTILYDCTDSQSSEEKIQMHQIPLVKVSPWEILQGKKCERDSYCLFGSKGSLDTFLGHILLQHFTTYESVILILDESDLGKAIEILGGMLTCIVNIVYPFERDVNKASKVLNRFAGRKVLPMNIAYAGDCSMESIKLAVPGAFVIKPYTFADFDNNWIYKKVVGGC